MQNAEWITTTSKQLRAAQSAVLSEYSTKYWNEVFGSIAACVPDGPSKRKTAGVALLTLVLGFPAVMIGMLLANNASGADLFANVGLVVAGFLGFVMVATFIGFMALKDQLVHQKLYHRHIAYPSKVDFSIQTKGDKIWFAAQDEHGEQIVWESTKPDLCQEGTRCLEDISIGMVEFVDQRVNEAREKALRANKRKVDLYYAG